MVVVAGRSTRSLESSYMHRGLLSSVLLAIPVLAHTDTADLAYLEKLVAQNPEREAAAAIQRGAPRFLGVAGYTVEIPGIPESISQCGAVRRHLEIIRGTSDVVSGQRHIELIAQARSYASRFNIVVAKNLRGAIVRECAAP
jgi:hypothetical protein